MRIVIRRRVIYLTAPSVVVKHYPEAIERNGHLCKGYGYNEAPTPTGAECIRCGTSILGWGALDALTREPCTGGKT